jgi:hypothetical protein
MSQRDSGYARKERDFYETPEWVTNALEPHLPTYALHRIWEPASGTGKMVDVFREWGAGWLATDVVPMSDGIDALNFLTTETLPSAVYGPSISSIITNPPYESAQEFCEHALRLMEPCDGLVAMLLRTDFDHAKGRTHLFRDNPAFAKKVVLMKRIAWFVEADGRPKASPSFNHAWYIWDWKHSGPPSIAYGP